MREFTTEELSDIEVALIYASRYLKGDSVLPQVLEKNNYKERLDRFQQLINKVNKERHL